MKKLIILIFTLTIITALSCNNTEPSTTPIIPVEISSNTVRAVFVIISRNCPVDLYCLHSGSDYIIYYPNEICNQSLSFSQSIDATNYCSISATNLDENFGISLELFIDGVLVDRSFSIKDSGITNISVQYSGDK